MTCHHHRSYFCVLCAASLLVQLVVWAMPSTAVAEPPMQPIDLPTSAGDGKPIEVKVLVDNPALKIAVLTLRKGAVLPKHDAPVPVTIQAISGHGTIKVSGVEAPLSTSQMVYLDAKAPHEISPAKDTDLILMVHYLRGGHAGP